MRYTLKGPLKGEEMTLECGMAVQVKRCAHFSGNPRDGDILAIHLIIMIVKMMHRGFVVRESLCLLRHSLCVGSASGIGQKAIFES